MKNLLITGFIILSSLTVMHAQFDYAAWNTGIEYGNLSIKNGMAHYAIDPNTFQPYLADSVDCYYKGTMNYRFNIEAVTPKYYIKTGVSLPIHRPGEQDTTYYTGRHYEVNIMAGMGFSIKDVVGIQFGFNLGSMGVIQERNYKMEGTDKFDYFVPSAGSTPVDGQHVFGNMNAWQAGLMMNTIVAINDNLGVRLSYSHNNLSHKSITVKGRNDQFELGLYYYNLDWHNAGLSIVVQQNYMHFKGYSLEDAHNAGTFDRAYPATKVRMTCIYLGLNIPLTFGQRD